MKMLWGNCPEEILSGFGRLLGILHPGGGGRILHGKISMGDFHQKKFSMGKFSVPETFRWGVELQEILSKNMKNIIYDLKKDEKLNKNKSFFK